MEALHYYEGQWLSGNPPIIGAGSHAFWLGSIVFDGARAFNGVAPDLEAHCARTLRSAQKIEMEPQIALEDMLQIAWDGIGRFPKDQALYLRPVFFADEGFIVPVAESTKFCLSVMPLDMPDNNGMAVCLADHIRRPNPDQAPVDSKASALYPNSWREFKRLQAKGFNTGIALDSLGNVAEFLTSNLFIVKDGVAITPSANGCFLAGITRQRVMDLLKADGITTLERRVTFDDVLEADEIFSTGNYGKIQAVTRVEDRIKSFGPVTKRARELYWDFAHSQTNPFFIEERAAG